MKTIIKTTHQSIGKVNDIWNLLKNGTDVDKWLPFIATCKLQGEGEGAKRLCKTDQGKDVNETILKIDHDTCTFVYGIDSHTMEMPTKDIIGTMKVEELSGKTVSSWEIEYNYTIDLEDSVKNEIEQGFKGMMSMGLQGLDNLLN